METLESNIEILHGNVETLSSNIDILHGNVETLTSNIDILHGNVETISRNIDTLHGNVETIESYISILHGNVETLTDDLASNASSIDTLDSTLSSHGTRLGDLEDADAAHGNRLDTLEDDVEYIEDNYATISYVNLTTFGQAATSTAIDSAITAFSQNQLDDLIDSRINDFETNDLFPNYVQKPGDWDAQTASDPVASGGSLKTYVEEVINDLEQDTLVFHPLDWTDYLPRDLKGYTEGKVNDFKPTDWSSVPLPQGTTESNLKLYTQWKVDRLKEGRGNGTNDEDSYLKVRDSSVSSN